jgi:hypothetical protein
LFLQNVSALKGHLQGTIRVIKYKVIELRSHSYKSFLHHAVKCGLKISSNSGLKGKYVSEVDGVGG